MAWEWVGPVATAAVGIAGIFGTWLNGKQARDDARTLAGDALAHQRLLAEDARRQQRLENAYVDVLEMAERASQWAQIAYPMMDTSPPAPVPPLPSLDTQSHAQALVQAFGSDDVLGLLEAWRKVILEMVRCDRLIKMGLEHDVGREPPSHIRRTAPPRARSPRGSRPTGLNRTRSPRTRSETQPQQPATPTA